MIRRRSVAYEISRPNSLFSAGPMYLPRQGDVHRGFNKLCIPALLVKPTCPFEAEAVKSVL